MLLACWLLFKELPGFKVDFPSSHCLLAYLVPVCYRNSRCSRSVASQLSTDSILQPSSLAGSSVLDSSPSMCLLTTTYLHRPSGCRGHACIVRYARASQISLSDESE